MVWAGRIRRQGFPAADFVLIDYVAVVHIQQRDLAVFRATSQQDTVALIDPRESMGRLATTGPARGDSPRFDVDLGDLVPGVGVGRGPVGGQGETLGSAGYGNETDLAGAVSRSSSTVKISMPSREGSLTHSSLVAAA